MAGLINIGLTGVLSHQSALNTTGNNISNANTAGYSRQDVLFETQTGARTGAGTAGTGVNVADIRRIASSFVTEQLRSDTALFNEQQTLNGELSRLDNLLGGDSTGLNNALNNFFASLQSAAEDPAALPQRQLVLSEAQALINRFQSLNSAFIQQRESINSQIGAATSDVNALLSSIADLNLAISETPGLAQGNLPNDLLDQRDEKLRELSALMKIRVVDAGASQVNVQMSNGQALVIGAEASRLGVQRSAEDPTAVDFTLTTGNQTRVVTEQVVGGKLGGLREFAAGPLNVAFDELGRVAVALSDQINRQHQIGMDLENDLGGLFFTDINSRDAQLGRVTPNSNNQPPKDGVVSVEITDTSVLEAGSYTLKFVDSQNFTLVDKASGDVVRQGQIPATLPAELSLPGFNIRIESGTFAQGDSYLVRPTRGAASALALQVEREEDLAFASPIRAEGDAGNTGNGVISQGTMLAVRNPLTNVPLPAFSQRGELSPPLMVEFVSATEYQILDASDPANPVPLTPPVTGQTFQPGIANKLFSENPGDPNYRGFQFTLNGNPQANDRFLINYNTDGISDNRNVGLLGGLATANTMNGGNQSFTEAYGGLVEEVGVATRQSQLDLDAGQTLLEQTRNQRESISGVNLDEEAGRLIQYQAAYNASAKVMSVAQDLFDTLLSTFR
ncbi:MAG: flagellar hook-associated protein FlgK [Marinobacter sp.]|uniref:flagellar hook-associated protein FlgK n=1 Tax=Marinobacter sp. TaxID=50741 RepID=UPI00299E3865|nr:flagellar hook-associated protein FlgK [Marinobacter sp.]MDX1635603.1 flagellar hook-associated protein FlgK [Marinobacter sp.]